MYHSVLRPGAQRQLKKIGTADLVIGLPSYKNAQTAALTAQVALEGAHKQYPELRAVLINADAGYKAATRKAVAAQSFSNGHNRLVVSGRYHGLLGRGSAIAALLDAALALDAKAIVILDSQTAGLTPDWVAGLAHLVLNNKADLVVPRYREWTLPHGILSDLISYPLFRALWGVSLRRPAAPDFALSPQLAVALLDEDIWGTAASAFGLPTWLTTYGVVNRWRVAQSALSQKYNHIQPAKKQSGAQFKARFQDILSVMFSLGHKYKNHWQHVVRVRSLPTLTRFATESGPDNKKSDNPPTRYTNPNLNLMRQTDTEQLLDNLALGWITHRVLWQRILAADNLVQIEALAALPADRFYFPSDLWAKIIYDFMVVFNKGHADPAQIVASLYPIYQGRLAAFEQEVDGLAAVAREGTVAAQAVEFEETRPYLTERWRAYQPFM